MKDAIHLSSSSWGIAILGFADRSMSINFFISLLLRDCLFIVPIVRNVPSLSRYVSVISVIRPANVPLAFRRTISDRGMDFVIKKPDVRYTLASVSISAYVPRVNPSHIDANAAIPTMHPKIIRKGESKPINVIAIIRKPGVSNPIRVLAAVRSKLNRLRMISELRLLFPSPGMRVRVAHPGVRVRAYIALQNRAHKGIVSL